MVSILDRFRRDKGPEKRLLDSSTVPAFSGDGRLADPSALNEDGALRLGPVLSAGRLLASNIAGMPLCMYRTTRDGNSVRLPLNSLFTKPSRVGVLRDWLFRAVTSLAYRGNAVGIIMERDALEYPTRIEWVDPALVFVEDNLQLTPLDTPGSFTNPKWYYLGEHVPSEDIVHIPWFQLPGRVWGLSPIGAYAITTSTGLAAQKFADDWYRAGGTPPGQFKNTQQTVNPTEAVEIKRRVVQAIRTREPLVYGADWDYTPFTITANDAQFVETQRLTASIIAHIYGIPPEMIGGETGGSYTYSSPEQRQIEFVQMCLLPWLLLLEDHFSALLPRGQYVKFDTDVLVRADLETRFAVYEKARLIGFDNIDGLRAREDLAPLPNGAGQDYSPLPIAAGKPVAVPSLRSDDSEAARRDIEDGSAETD